MESLMFVLIKISVSIVVILLNAVMALALYNLWKMS